MLYDVLADRDEPMGGVFWAAEKSIAGTAAAFTAELGAKLLSL
jgi:hypothetical protein